MTLVEATVERRGFETQFQDEGIDHCKPKERALFSAVEGLFQLQDLASVLTQPLWGVNENIIVDWGKEKGLWNIVLPKVISLLNEHYMK